MLRSHNLDGKVVKRCGVYYVECEEEDEEKETPWGRKEETNAPSKILSARTVNKSERERALVRES